MAGLNRDQLEAGLDHVGAAPVEIGRLELLVTRPAEEERVLAASGALDLEDGLLGDSWSRRPSSSTADGGPNPAAQVTVMNARAAALFSDSEEQIEWAQAGDQLYVDFDLSKANLPTGAQFAIGDAVLEVTAEPHLGCGKFSRRFGVDALKVVNSSVGRAMRLRGVNTRVVEPGSIGVGDAVRKLPGRPAPPST
jgi:MOSC domain-containing protein YiiM